MKVVRDVDFGRMCCGREMNVRLFVGRDFTEKHVCPPALCSCRRLTLFCAAVSVEYERASNISGFYFSAKSVSGHIITFSLTICLSILYIYIYFFFFFFFTSIKLYVLLALWCMMSIRMGRSLNTYVSFLTFHVVILHHNPWLLLLLFFFCIYIYFLQHQIKLTDESADASSTTEIFTTVFCFNERL